MPSALERRRLRELAIQTRLRETFERSIRKPSEKLVSRQMITGVRGYLDNGPVGMQAALEGAGQEWFRIVTPHYAVVGGAFGARTLAALDATAPDFEVQLARWIQSEGLTQAKGLAGTTASDLRALIARGEAEGFSTAKIGREIRKAVPSMSRVRSRMIAQTETHNAASFGGQEAARGTGVQMRTVGLTHRAGAARTTHVEASMQIRDLDEPYLVGGFQMMRPGDSSLGAPAAEVINCRCGEIQEPVQ